MFTRFAARDAVIPRIAHFRIFAVEQLLICSLHHNFFLDSIYSSGNTRIRTMVQNFSAYF